MSIKAANLNVQLKKHETFCASHLKDPQKIKQAFCGFFFFEN